MIGLQFEKLLVFQPNQSLIESDQNVWGSVKTSLGTFAGVSFILVSSHCPEHMIILRVFADLAKLPFIVSMRWG